MSTIASAIASAIQLQEGYGTPNAVTLNANNNPGGLIAWPGYPTVNGFAQFPDYATGFAAVVSNVQNFIDEGLNLSQLTEKWAPSGAPNDPGGINQPSAYASFVSAQTGLPLDTPLNSLGSGTPTTIEMAADFPTLDLSSIFGDLGISTDSTLAGTLGNPSMGLLVGLGIGAILLWLAFKD
jgi:hypothetical protein